MVDRVTTRRVHPQRTSEANEVPATWGINEIKRLLDAMPAEQRAGARIVGWSGVELQCDERMTDSEYYLACRRELAATLRAALADGVISADEQAQIDAVLGTTAGA